MMPPRGQILTRIWGPEVDHAPAVAKTPKLAVGDELTVSIASTKAQMEAFAKSHPELGEIEGRTKAIFLENLQRAWEKRNGSLGRVVQRPAVQKRATMPVSADSTMKEL